MDGRATVTDPSVGELFGKLARETGLLLRQEVALVTLEMKNKARAAMVHAALIGAGVVVALMGGNALVAAAVLGLAMVLPLWLAALSVGVAVTLLGVVAIGMGRAALGRMELSPHKTIETLGETKTWAQQLVR